MQDAGWRESTSIWGCSKDDWTEAPSFSASQVMMETMEDYGLSVESVKSEQTAMKML